jgi:hypothetical protein
MLEQLIARQRSRAVETLNRLVPWHKLPLWLGLANLRELRDTLRAENLHDTSGIDVPDEHDHVHVAKRVEPEPPSSAVLHTRSADGSYNDLESPRMGMVGMRFGRNIPVSQVRPERGERLRTPNPRLASEPHELPLPAADTWPERPMRVQRTRKDPTRCPMSGGTPTFTNDVTHWWDASQVYGSTLAQQRKLRTGQGGKLLLDARGRLPVDPESGFELTGFVADTSWAPLSLLHTLFVREHNAICDALHDAYPEWDDEALFQRARLVNAALLAKIHTVEWTPALLTHPTITTAMHTNWWGVFGERIRNAYGRVVDDEVLAGIPGGGRDHFGVPYAITEEFVSVYRMHSLVPDELVLRSLRNDAELARRGLLDVVGKGSATLLDDFGVDDLLYSFGVAHPGAMRLHNFPQALRTLTRFDGTRVDLATIDVLRDRERGVPRYTEFRRLFHLQVPRTFEELTDDPEWARELRSVYGSVDDVDLLPGMLAEPLPEGMAFGDTAFRVFILMASRRLNSDRFFTTDFTPEVYSEVGMRWVQDNTMSSVLLRHCPALAPALSHVKNAFWPWSRVRLS